MSLYNSPRIIYFNYTFAYVCVVVYSDLLICRIYRTLAVHESNFSDGSETGYNEIPN